MEDRYMIIENKEDIISLIWKEETSSFTDNDFKKEAKEFANMVRESKCKKILVDMRLFRYSLRPELIDWREKNIVSVYNELGVKRFAFVTNNTAVNQDKPHYSFITKYFKDISEAKKWLLESII